VIRFLLFLIIAGALAYCGATVKLGKRTFFGHVHAIWHTEEAQDLKQGVEQTAAPAVERVERGIHAGVTAIREDSEPAARDAGSGSAVLAVPAPTRPAPGSP
jgi:hypothetical protein